MKRLMKDNAAMKGDEAKEPKNKYARFFLNLDIDEDSTLTLRDSEYVMKHVTCWTKTYNITFRFIEHPESSDYQNRCITLYEEHSFNMFYEQDSLRTMKSIIAMSLSLSSAEIELIWKTDKDQFQMIPDENSRRQC